MVFTFVCASFSTHGVSVRGKRLWCVVILNIFNEPADILRKDFRPHTSLHLILLLAFSLPIQKDNLSITITHL